MKGGSETILVVDDEASVRELAVQILQRHGYQVLAADCGEAALEIFQTRKAGLTWSSSIWGCPVWAA